MWHFWPSCSADPGSINKSGIAAELLCALGSDILTAATHRSRASRIAWGRPGASPGWSCPRGVSFDQVD